MLVEQLVKARIRVYPCATWDSQGEIQAKPYTEESEEQAAQIIDNQARDGKTVVLIGGKHAEYGDGRKTLRFPRTADCIKSLGKRVKSVAIAGGMQTPLGYDRDPEELMRKAARKSNVQIATYIDISGQRIDKYHNDGILVLPEVPFLAANQPIPLERMSIGMINKGIG